MQSTLTRIRRQVQREPAHPTLIPMENVPPIIVRARRALVDESGAATAEYAIATLATV